jgi:hypothetical protein
MLLVIKRIPISIKPKQPSCPTKNINRSFEKNKPPGGTPARDKIKKLKEIAKNLLLRFKYTKSSIFKKNLFVIQSQEYIRTKKKPTIVKI